MRLLIVDDERDLATELAAILRGEGWVVDVAHDGLTGLAMAEYGGYDVVLLDIMLPGRNGYDVLKRIRASDPTTAVVMFSAKDGEFDQSDAFELGADDYVTKPFSVVVLAARLHAVLRRSGVPRRALVWRIHHTITTAPVSMSATNRPIAMSCLAPSSVWTCTYDAKFWIAPCCTFDSLRMVRQRRATLPCQFARSAVSWKTRSSGSVSRV